MVLTMTDEQLLTVAEVDQQMRAREDTVRRWLRSGRLRGFQPGGTRLGWRVTTSEVQRFMRDLAIDQRQASVEHLEQLEEDRRRIRGEVD